jgi:hypothetical protein
MDGPNESIFVGDICNFKLARRNLVEKESNGIS